MAATDPSISVLLPIRNGAVYLSECIDSLKAQTFDDFEVLAVDDGSTDRTPQILAQWASEDRRVVVTSRAPMGITAALEAGRLRARGRYLARMDSDDIADLLQNIPQDRAPGGPPRTFRMWGSRALLPERGRAGRWFALRGVAERNNDSGRRRA